MNRTTLARRYAPLAVVMAVQLLLVAVVPSTGRSSGALSGLSTGPGGLGAGGSDLAGGATGTDVGGVAGGGAGSTGAGGGAGGANGTVVGQAPGAPPGVPPGDTTHCVNGREFDPSIAYYAPPCVPGTPGGPFANNGGSTYSGVSANQVTIVDYITNYGAEVNAILKAKGTLETYDQAKIIDQAFENFINKKFVLYGRKFHIVTYQGTQRSVPPDTQNLIAEFDRVIDTYHPIMVFWNTTLCSACYAEIARRKVIGVGGIGFSDKFAQQNYPYFYAPGGSSTMVETAFADWWCRQMSSVSNPSRKSKFGMNVTGAQNFNGRTRVLGVISTNDPDNEDTVEKDVLYPELQHRCRDDQGVQAHHYFYAQDINTAPQQTAAGIDAMDTQNNPATTVLCICDSVAPDFLYKGEQDKDYYPENVLADVQGMGADSAAQDYDSQVVACQRKGARPCAFDNAVGLLDSEIDTAPAAMPGVKVFRMGGGTDIPTSAYQLNTVVKPFLMMASLIEAAGPNLNPATIANQATSLGSAGGGASQLPLVGFKRGNGYWTQDVRFAYWNAKQPSPYNGSAGRYITTGSRRYRTGDFPDLPSGPDVPIPEQRT